MNSSGSGNINIFVSLTWTSDNVSHVLFNGQCVVAENIGLTVNWKCANQCRLLTTGKIEVVSMYKERSRGRREVKEE